MSQTLCKHIPHKVIDDIWNPRYSTDDVLVNVAKIPNSIEHVLLKFTKCNKYKEWMYFSAKDIRKCKQQRNGSGMMYIVPMNKRQDLIINKECEH